MSVETVLPRWRRGAAASGWRPMKALLFAVVLAAGCVGRVEVEGGEEPSPVAGGTGGSASVDAGQGADDTADPCPAFGGVCRPCVFAGMAMCCCQ